MTGFPVRFQLAFHLLLAALAVQAVVWAQAPPQAVERDPKLTAASTTVYATRTGEKYHRETCRYLSKSKIPMELKDAAARYVGSVQFRKPQSFF